MNTMKRKHSKLPGMARRRQGGFTLIELVSVITLTGVIAVAGVPRFMDLTSNGHEAAVEGAASGLRASIKNHQTLWFIHGENDQVRNLLGSVGDQLDVNDQGYPLGLNVTNGQLNNNRIGVQGENNIHGCRDVWNGMLNPAPSVSNNNDGADFEYYRHTGGRVCSFVYRKNGDTVNNRANTQLGLRYDSRDGSVTLCGRSLEDAPNC